MRKNKDNSFSDLNEIRILIFNIMGVWLGIDMEQISEMYRMDQLKERDFELLWFHEKLLFKMENIHYNSPMILLIKDENFSIGLIIDQPEDINVSVPIDSIHPMPPLIEASVKSSPIWSVTVIDEKIVLLVDAYRLLAAQSIAEVSPSFMQNEDLQPG